MNNNVSFGMAFRLPQTLQAQKRLSESLNLDTPLKKRGFKQFVREQKKLTRFDTRYNLLNGDVEVINNKTNQIEKIYSTPGYENAHNTCDEYSRNTLPIIDKIFNPKAFLPFDFYQAGEKAKELERKAIKEEKTLKNTLDTILKL